MGARRCSDWCVWLSIRLSEDWRVIGSRLPWTLHIPCFEIPLIDFNVSLHNYDDVSFVLSWISVFVFSRHVAVLWFKGTCQLSSVIFVQCHCKILLCKIAVPIRSAFGNFCHLGPFNNSFAILWNLSPAKFALYHLCKIKFLRKNSNKKVVEDFV